MNRTVMQTLRLRMVWIGSLIPMAFLIAFAFQTSVLSGQEDDSLSTVKELRMLDSSIPDFLAISKLKGIFKEDSLKQLLLIKRSSLESRLKQSQKNASTVSKRMAEWKDNAQKLHDQLRHIEAKARTNSPIYLMSKASAEQLLVAAQLELQKVNWELASEQELFEVTKKEEAGSHSNSDTERALAVIELQSIVEAQEAAAKELAVAENLQKTGGIGQMEAVKIKQSASKADLAVQAQQLRIKEIVARQKAQKNSQSAGINAQIKKLTARKTQIEKHINEIYVSMSDLYEREQLLVQIDRLEMAIDASFQLRNEMELKTEEIEGLLAILNEVTLGENKAKE